MTQEEKQLLLKDLCARLPYYVELWSPVADNNWAILTPVIVSNLFSADLSLPQVKPYLRPMSSMTEEEFEKLKEYSGLVYDQLDLASFQDGAYKCLDFYLNEVPADVVILVFDWLNAHHFDYRGLIPMGLALEAPMDMYRN